MFDIRGTVLVVRVLASNVHTALRAVEEKLNKQNVRSKATAKH